VYGSRDSFETDSDDVRPEREVSDAMRHRIYDPHLFPDDRVCLSRVFLRIHYRDEVREQGLNGYDIRYSILAFFKGNEICPVRSRNWNPMICNWTISVNEKKAVPKTGYMHIYVGTCVVFVYNVSSVGCRFVVYLL